MAEKGLQAGSPDALISFLGTFCAYIGKVEVGDAWAWEVMYSQNDGDMGRPFILPLLTSGHVHWPGNTQIPVDRAFPGVQQFWAARFPKTETAVASQKLVCNYPYTAYVLLTGNGAEQIIEC
ncbi:hypothetical protein ACO22_07591 [Paracoccidioides brasiliensis]|uniref:Leucine-rich repeat domain-containing protein n=1 Tax=Paracoccidioides brasiliensis TaxID=121759 RepID=A0A1D2J463_PARBR|nr:hypothetical protein ACO22_07591 [Paracoccidioides brasiliensis]